jgi:predicted NAD/FAD-binding protein
LRRVQPSIRRFSPATPHRRWRCWRTHDCRARFWGYRLAAQRGGVARDPRWLPERQRAWASWNYRLSEQDQASACVTYNMNILQGCQQAPLFCVTLNPDAPVDDRYVWKRFVYEHPLFNPQSWRPRRGAKRLTAAAELVLRRLLVQRLS